MKKTILLCLLLFALMFYSTAQSIKPNLDFYSRYVWRGMDFGLSPSIQPSIEYSYKGLDVGLWGAYTTNINHPAQEFDVYAQYTFLNELFTVSVTDFFFPSDGADNKYFEYGDKTKHLYEVVFSYNGVEKFPLGVLFSTFFYGDDKDFYGNNRYSAYAELFYNTSINQMPFSVFCGVNLTENSRDFLNTDYNSGFYADKYGIVNLGFSTSKDIKISESFSIPLNMSFVTNPLKGNVFLVAGVSL